MEMITRNEKRETRHWIICALGAFLLLGALFFSLYECNELLTARAQRAAILETSRQAARMSRWHSELTAAMVILAEQKGMRDGVMRLTAGNASRDLHEGFLMGIEAACRLFPATHPGVEGLTLRGPGGSKWVGMGMPMDSLVVKYPDYRERYRIVPAEPQPGKVLERWVVPVRDAQAQPLAFLVADVNLSDAGKAFTEVDTLSADRTFTAELARWRRNAVLGGVSGVILLGLLGLAMSKRRN